MEDADCCPGEDPYLSSYADLSVHKLMLRDKPRTLAYKNFIESHQHLFEDKVVMDVGAGTGILSLFAAKAGAKKVYAVECSAVSSLCERLVQRNGYSGVIEVIRGKVEDMALEEKVDVIVSEWMGFYLLHESMLSSVLAARDRFLKPGGLLVPSGARLLACLTSIDSAHRAESSFWRDVYGFDFGPAAEVAACQRALEPQVIALEKGDLLSKPRLVTGLEMAYAEETEFEEVRTDLKFQVDRYGVIRGLALWFDALFEGGETEEEDNAEEGGEKDNAFRLGTGPESPETHWKQTVIMLPEARLVSPGTTFACRLELKRNPLDRRKYLLTLEVPEEEEEEEREEGEDEEDEEWHDEVLGMIQERIS